MHTDLARFLGEIVAGRVDSLELEREGQQVPRAAAG